MEGYADRLLTEYTELEERTTKLQAFFDDGRVDALPLEERSYLEAQLPVQKQLLSILEARVAALPAEAVEEDQEDELSKG